MAQMNTFELILALVCRFSSVGFLRLMRVRIISSGVSNELSRRYRSFQHHVWDARCDPGMAGETTVIALGGPFISCIKDRPGVAWNINLNWGPSKDDTAKCNRSGAHCKMKQDLTNDARWASNLLISQHETLGVEMHSCAGIHTSHTGPQVHLTED